MNSKEIKYTRECPNPKNNLNCLVVIHYKTKERFNHANLHNRSCKSCTLYGIEKTEEHKKNLHKPKSDSSRMGRYDKTGKNNPMFGKHHSDKTKLEQSKRMKENNPLHDPVIRLRHKQSMNTEERKMASKMANFNFLKSGRSKKSGTSIELTMKSLLDDLSITYEHQSIFKYYNFDFYLPKYDIYLECDGDYWHANPKFYGDKKLNETQKNNAWRGKAKDTFMKNQGKILLRFWEYDLKNNINDVRLTIQNCIKEQVCHS